jgi:hypothetical protein
VSEQARSDKIRDAQALQAATGALQLLQAKYDTLLQQYSGRVQEETALHALNAQLQTQNAELQRSLDHTNASLEAARNAVLKPTAPAPVAKTPAEAADMVPRAQLARVMAALDEERTRVAQRTAVQNIEHARLLDQLAMTNVSLSFFFSPLCCFFSPEFCSTAFASLRSKPRRSSDF